MLSSGGVTSAQTAARFPVRIIESGPTAAVIAGQYYGKRFDVPERLKPTPDSFAKSRQQ